MATNHVELNEQIARSSRMMNAIRSIAANLHTLKIEQAAMLKMLSGDGSSASHFTKLVDIYGVAAETGGDDTSKPAKAKVMFDELSSTLGNSAALEQFLAIMG